MGIRRVLNCPTLVISSKPHVDDAHHALRQTRLCVLISLASRSEIIMPQRCGSTIARRNNWECHVMIILSVIPAKKTGNYQFHIASEVSRTTFRRMF